MASLMAPVENGKIVETTSQNSLKNKKTNTSGMDKESFLQLLVAQMKYQDPLEPTSNTEYIAQYAQFSQVEQLQNMAASTDLSRASSLVGKHVYVKTTDASGATVETYGKVDYVVYENGKAYLSINESLYSLDDLGSVVDKTYKDAYEKAYDFTARLNKLPAVTSVDLTDAGEIDELEKIYRGMDDYEKSFVAEDTVKRLDKYVARLQEVRRAAEQSVVNDFNRRLAVLPQPEAMTQEHLEEIAELSEMYNSLSEDGRKLVAQEDVEKLAQYRAKADELAKAGAAAKPDATEKAEETGTSGEQA